MSSVKKSTFEDQLKEKGTIAYVNVGDSMMPLIKQGRDVLIISRPKSWNEIDNNIESERNNPVKKCKRLDIPLYKRDSGTYVLHRILKVRENDYVICGDNRYCIETGISDRHIIGMLSGIQRNGRIISCDSLKYKLYSHLWCDFFLIRAGILMVVNHLKTVRKSVSRKDSS